MKQIDAFPYKGHIIYVFDAGQDLVLKVFKDGSQLPGANHSVTKEEGEYDPQYYNDAFYLMIQVIESTLPKFIISFSYRTGGKELTNFFTYRNPTKYSEQIALKIIEHHLEDTQGISNLPISINFHREIRASPIE